MAALQSIRKRGALLIGIIGLALFAFIAEEFFRSFQTSSNLDRMKMGEVCGTSISAQEFQQEVEERTEVVKIQKAMSGQSETLTDQEQEQVRQTVWQEFVQATIIAEEAEKLGLEVTKEDEQNALRDGQSASLQLMAQLGFANPQTRQFDVTALQDFLKNYDKSISQMAQAGQQEYIEQYQNIRRIWDYTEKQLKKEILQQKYGILLSQTFLSNPVSAKMDFDDATVKYTAEVVAVPYTTINDKDVKPTEAELKATYDRYKELFPVQGKSASLKLLDVTVTASEADKNALMAEVQGYQERLQGGEDAASVVGSSKTISNYVNMPMTKKAFQQMPDVASALDSMAVGAVKPAYYNAQDNTINTLKLISKVQMPDSVLYRVIAAVGKTPEESATRADSILKAIQGGAAFKDIAKKYQQNGDSVWMYSSQYEGSAIPEEEAKIINEINTMEPGVKVVTNAQGSMIVQVLQRKNMETKYNVAVIKCPLNFSKDTYNAALNKINKFLADNRNLADMKKNAAKAGYVLEDIPNYQQDNMQIQMQIGGSGVKDAVRWVFDEAKAGEISKLYDCGRNNDHLLVIGVQSIEKGKYLSLDNEEVKKAITQLCIQEKKGNKLMEQLKGVKNLAEAKKQKGAVSQELTDVVFLASPALDQVKVAEPKLAGAIARTAKGQFSGAVKGAAAIYFAQTNNVAAGEEKFEEKAVMEQSAQQSGQVVMRTLLQSLIEKANVKDNRYKF